MNQKVLKNAKEVQIDDFVFKKIEGYPLFGFRFDEKKNQFAIANLKSKTYTSPFIDDIEVNAKPLLTWVANYVVARIQDKWYLCDCDGNCYQESGSPITICRNLFVIEKELAVITQSLERKIVPNLFIWETHSKQYLFVSVPLRSNEEYMRLLDIDGDASSIVSDNEDELIQWKALKTNSYNRIIFGVDFKTITYHSLNYEIIGKKSATFDAYNYTSGNFSARLIGEFHFYKYDELEVLIGEGKTYFFKTIDDIEVVDFEISVPKIIGNTIVYRQGKKIVERDLQGNIHTENTISTVEAYQFALLENFNNKLTRE